MKKFIFDLKNDTGSKLKIVLKNEKEQIASGAFRNYFYIEDKSIEKEIKTMTEVFSVEKVEKTDNGKTKDFLKIETNEPGEVIKLREDLKEFGPRESRIPYVYRYLIDKDLYPMTYYDFELKEGEILKMKKSEQEDIKLKACAFDIETYNKDGFPNPEKDPILMISYADEKEQTVFYWTKTKSSEKEMILNFLNKIEKKDPDVLIGYNSSGFDLPYLKKRCSKLGIEMGLSKDKSPVILKSTGFSTKADIFGRFHLDAYDGVSFLAGIGAINIPKLNLESIYKEMIGKEKIDINTSDLWKMWENGGKELETLIQYNKEDSIAAYEIGMEILPLYIEISRIVGIPIYEASRMATSQMVEWLLVREAHKRNIIIPKTPKGVEIAARAQNPIKGAFVKLPKSGLHENLAVCDFRSLYPSLIIEYNIDQTTLSNKGNKSPMGHYFSTEQEGLIPQMLRELIDYRAKVKKEMKKFKRGTKEYKSLYARQWALKIIANSAYGYMAYARAKWYSREAAESVTAWARQYIHETIEKAEQENFEVLYADSITANRFVTIKDPKGTVKIKNIEELFDENKKNKFKRGLKEIIKLKDYKALSVNPKTGKSTWSDINEIIRHKNKKTIYRVNQKYGESIVTEDHSFITKEKNNFIETKPTDMKNKKMIRVEKIPKVKQIKKIDMYELLKKYSYKTIYKGNEKKSTIKKDKNHVWFNWTNRKNPVKLKRFIKIKSEEFKAICRLLGAYIAEGSSSTIETTKKRGTSISSSDKKWLEDLQKDYHLLFKNVKTSIIQSTKKERILNYELNGKIKTVKYKDNTHKFQMMNEISAIFFKMLCGQTSEGKKIPDFIFHVPIKYKKIFLDKMIEGDGSTTTNKRLPYSDKYKDYFFRYETKSLHLISGLSFLLNQLNKKYAIRYNPIKKTYILTITTKGYNKILRSKIIKEKYDGYVYDLSVKDSHMFVDSCGQILLHNTDSVFLKLNEKKQDDVKKFVEKINNDLPEKMELEFEGYYPRGIFVTKREGGAAKKKYALMREDKTLEIKGFELVRRDWANIAKTAQEEVIKAVLEEGKPEKAIDTVKKIIQDLREYKVKQRDLIIYTQIKRKVSNYEQQAPHVKAAKKLMKEGIKVKTGTVLEYIITQGSGSISDRAIPIELIGSRKYDPDYYIENQVLPAVMKILHELGVNEDDLKYKGTQQGLKKWF